MEKILEKISMTKKEFKELMQVLSKVAKDDVRPILQGVCFKGNEVTAIDGYRLSQRKLKTNSNLNIECVIHANRLKEVVKACNSKIENVEMIFLMDKATFNLYDKEKNLVNSIETEYLRGPYTNYKSIIPDFYEGNLKINDTKKILDAIKNLKKHQTVVLDIIEDNINLYTQEHDNGITKLTLLKRIELKDKATQNVLIGVNSTYLKDAIKDSREFKLTYKNKVCPLIFEDIEKNSYELVLPVRLIGEIVKAS